MMMSCRKDVCQVPADPSVRARRKAVLARKLPSLVGFDLSVDCGNLNCAGERTYPVVEFGGAFRRWRTLGGVLRRWRCPRCGQPASRAWLISGEAYDMRFSGWRVPLVGPEAED
jgi:hypothetical protein